MTSLLDLIPDDLTEAEALEWLEEMSDQDCLAELHDWDGLLARDSQRPPPGEWRDWLLLTGRGYGKTRVGAEWIIDGTRTGMRRQALVAATYGDVRDIMIEGEAGILAVSPPGWRPRYLKSERKMVWPNGCIATAFAGEEPERLRGPAHHRAWVEELAAWRNVANRHTAIYNLRFGLRLGDKPQAYISTTPKPIKILRDLVKDPLCIVVGGSTYDNEDNLSPMFFKTVVAEYAGTSLGAQELDGLLLDEVKGSLWKRKWYDRDRVQEMPDCFHVAVALDPNVTDDNPEADEAGIIWGGAKRFGRDVHYYIGGDLTCANGTEVWSKRTIDCYAVNNCDKIVYEANQGGDLVARTMRVAWKDSDHKGPLPIRKVTATRGKRTRAEPIALLSEQGKIHHVGRLDHLEDQLCSWVPGTGKSPGRLDAKVWLVTHLMSLMTGSAAPAGTKQVSRFRTG